MSSVVKALIFGGGVLGLSILGVGGYVMSKDISNSSLDIPKKHRTWKPVRQRNGDGDLLKKFRNFFVDVSDSQNDSWFKTKFDEIKEKLTKKEQWKDVNSKESLKSKCKLAYDVKTIQDFQKIHLALEDLLTYCSELGGKPKTNKDKNKTYNSGTIGAANVDKWVYAEDDTNDKFWDIRNDEFQGVNGLQQLNLSITGSEDPYFTQGRKNKTHIKELCRDVYSSPKENAEPKLSNAFYLCTFHDSI